MTQRRTRDVLQRTVPQVVGHVRRGFPRSLPDLRPRIDHHGHSNDNESPTYRVDESSLRLNCGSIATSDAGHERTRRHSRFRSRWRCASESTARIIAIQDDRSWSRSVQPHDRLRVVLRGWFERAANFGGRGQQASKNRARFALTPLGQRFDASTPRTKLMLVKCGRRILVLVNARRHHRSPRRSRIPTRSASWSQACRPSSVEMFQTNTPRD